MKLQCKGNHLLMWQVGIFSIVITSDMYIHREVVRLVNIIYSDSVQ